MAALGAAAGAFEGDSQREAERARRAQLNLGAAGLQQSARQFAEQSRMRQAESAEGARRFDLGRQDDRANRDMQQANADRQFAQSERQMAQRDADTSFQQGIAARQEGRAARSAEWDDVLKEQEVAFQKQRYLQYKALLDEENKQKSERSKIAQSATASALRATMENGGIAPLSVVRQLSQDLGLDVRGLYFADDGSAAMDIMKDGQLVQEPIPVPVLQQIYRSSPGVFGDMAESLSANFMTKQKVQMSSEASAASRKQSNMDKAMLDERKMLHEQLNAHESGEIVLEDDVLKKKYARLNTLDKALNLSQAVQPLDAAGTTGDDGASAKTSKYEDGKVYEGVRNGKKVKARWNAAAQKFEQL